MRPAARDTDNHACMFLRPAPTPIPHVGGPVSTSPREVKINGLTAATYGDESECTGVGSAPPPKDSIVGGCLTVFIEGNPAARLAEKTFGGTVVFGSPNVFYSDAPGPLSELAANWLHQYLQQQPDIPFNHPWDGCYWRAERMRQILDSQFGVSAKKIFVHGDLQPIVGTLHDPLGHGPVEWGYYVVLIVDGVDSAGKSVQWVMDPSMSPNTVLTQSEWLDITKGTGTISKVSIQPGEAFAPGAGGRYSTDGRWADQRIEKYRQDVANGEYADPDASLAGHVANKASLAKPVVRPPHLP